MKNKILILLITVSNSSFSQKMIFNENYESLTDIDKNNWTPNVRFNKGDTVEFIGASKVNSNYLKVIANSKIVFVYFSTVFEADDFFEKKRLRMDSLNLFVINKNVESINKGDTVKILDANHGSMGIRNVKISNGTYEAETTLENITLRQALEKKVDIMIQTADELNAKADEKARVERNKRFKAKYGEVIFNRMLKGDPWIGMTSEMLLEMKGAPSKINRTVTSNDKDEQWVYGLGQYYYFKNGKLTSWQD